MIIRRRPIDEARFSKQHRRKDAKYSGEYNLSCFDKMRILITYNIYYLVKGCWTTPLFPHKGCLMFDINLDFVCGLHMNLGTTIFRER